MEGNVWTALDSPVQKHRTKPTRSKSSASLKAAPIILETPPSDVVERLSQYFYYAFGENAQENTFDCNHSSTQHRESSPESNSGDNLFITQNPVAEADRSVRRSHREPRSRLISVTDDDADEEGDGRSGAPRESVSCGIPSQKAVKGNLRRYSFPFLAKVYCSKTPSRRKSRRRGAHLPVHLNASLAGSAIGGFFKCVKAQRCSGRTAVESLVTPRYLDEEEPLSPLSEQEGSADEREDIRVVDKKLHASFVTECTQAMDTESKQEKNGQTKDKLSSKEKDVSPKGHIQGSSRPGLLSAGTRERVPIDLERVSSAEDNSSSRDPVFSGSPTNHVYERNEAKTSRSLRGTRAGKSNGLKSTTNREREEDACSQPATTPACEPWKLVGNPVGTVLLAETVTLSNVDDVLPQTGGIDNALLKPCLGVPEIPGDSANVEDKTFDAHKLKKIKKKKKGKRPDEVEDEGLQQPSSQEWEESREPSDAVLTDVGKDTPCLPESSRAEPGEGTKQQQKKKRKGEKNSLSLSVTAVAEEEESTVTSSLEGDVTQAADKTMRKKKKKNREKNFLSLSDAAVAEEESAVTSSLEGDVTQAADETMKKRKKETAMAFITLEDGREGTVSRPLSDVVETPGLCVEATKMSQNKFEPRDIENRLLCGDEAELKKPEKNTPVSSPYNCMELRQAEKEMLSNPEASTLQNDSMVTTERKNKLKKRKTPDLKGSEGRAKDSTAPYVNEINPKINTTEVIQNRTKCSIVEGGEGVGSHTSSSLHREDTIIRDSERSGKTLSKAKKLSKNRKSKALDNKISEDSSGDNVGIGLNGPIHANAVETTETEPRAKKMKKNRIGKCILASEEKQTLEMPAVMCDSPTSLEYTLPTHSRGIQSFLNLSPSLDNVSMKSYSDSLSDFAETTEKKSRTKQKKRKNNMQYIRGNEEQQTMEMPEVYSDSTISSEVHRLHSGGEVSLPNHGKKKKTKMVKKKLYAPEQDYLTS